MVKNLQASYYQIQRTMKSPTSSILQSIQALKSKLRTDHMELQGLRRDFAMGPARVIMQASEKQQSPVTHQLKWNKSLQKNARNKLIEVKKLHQIELKGIHEHYKVQKQQLIKSYETKIQQITKFFEQKINEQNTYSELLEEQLQRQNSAEKNEQQIQTNSVVLKIHSKVYQVSCNQVTFDERLHFKLFSSSESNERTLQVSSQEGEKNKYEQIVNKLLNQNAALLENVQTLKMENRKLLHSSNIQLHKQTSKLQFPIGIRTQYLQNIEQAKNSQTAAYMSVVPISVQDSIRESSYRSSCLGNKNRLKFSKANERSRHTQRSFASINNQNIDTSNLGYRHANSIETHEKKEEDPWDVIQNSFIEEESTILSEEMKLKTIKHFIRAVSHRSTQCQEPSEMYQVPKAPTRKGAGIRQLLRNLSVN